MSSRNNNVISLDPLGAHPRDVFRREEIRGAKAGKEGRKPVEAPDSLFSMAYARILDLVSEGEIEGLVDGLKSVYLDETPVKNADGSLNFKDVQIDTRLGTPDQAYIPGFPAVESETGVGIELEFGTPYVKSFSNLQLSAVRIRLSVPALSKTNISNGDIAGHRVEYAIDVATDGGAFAEVYKNAFAGKTGDKYERSHRIDLPAATTTGWVLRVRRLTTNSVDSYTQDTTMVESYTEIIDAKLRYPYSALVGIAIDAAQFRAIPRRAYDMKGLIIQVPSNYNPNTRTYTGVWDGTFQALWTNNPAWIYYAMLTNPRYGLGEVVNAADVDKWSLYNIARYCDEYVGTGKPLRASGVTTGSTSLSVTVSGTVYKIVRASGSFITNGFVVGDFVTTAGFSNPANVGSFEVTAVTATELTVSPRLALVAEAAGAGKSVVLRDEMEPRFTCTVYLQRRADAYKVLQDLASTFRGIAYWGSGSVIAVADRPEDPVYTYTNANVKDGRFVYQGSGRRARHTIALVQWSDPADFGRGKVEYVEDEEGLARYGPQETSVTAFGCTSQSQAHRIGRWILFSERLETDTVNFTVGLDGTLVAPGKIVRIADENKMGKRVGGRIVDAPTSTTVVVDKMPTPAPVASDTIVVSLPSGLVESRTVSSVNVGTRTITVSSAFSATPVPESVWVIESTELYAPTYRILAVTDGDGTSFGINALRHEPQKFAAAEQGYRVETRPTSLLPLTVQAAPTGLTLTANQRAGEAFVSPFLEAKWVPAAGALNYVIQWQRDFGEWSPPQEVVGTSAQLDNAFMGTYSFRIWAVNPLGITSPIAISADVVVADQTLTPGFVDALNTAIADALLTAENAQATADGAIVSFWQTTAPTIGAGPTDAKVGDIWFDTDNGNKIYRVVGAAWVEAADDDMAQALASASTAQATADGKVKTFFASSAPTPSAVGDLWFNTLTKVITRWNGSAWVAISDNDGSVTKPEVFNSSWEQGLLGWEDAVGAGLTGWYTEPGGYTGSTRLVKFGGAASSGIYNQPGMMTVTPGQRVAVSLVVDSQYNTGTMSFGLAYYDATGAYMAGVSGNWNDGSFNDASAPLAWKKLRRLLTVPAGAVGARFAIAVQSHASGAWKFDNAEVEFLPSTVDEVPDGPTYARMFGTYLQGGAPFNLSFGDNMVQNGRFEDTKFSVTHGAHANGTDLTPGWRTIDRSGDFSLGLEVVAETDSTRQMFIGQSGGFSVPNATAIQGCVGTKANYPVQAGEQYIITARAKWDSANAAPAGTGAYLDIGAFFYNAAGGYISESFNRETNAYGYNTFTKVEPTQHPFTVPAGAAVMVPFMRASFLNNSGAAYVTPFAIIHARFDDFTCRKVHLASAGQPNLLRNTDFNNGLSEWNGASSITLSPTEGNQIRVGALADGAIAYLFQDTVLGFDPGSYVTYSASCIQIGGVLAQGSRFHVYLEFFEGATYLGGVNASNVVPDTTLPLKFTRFSVTGRVPAGPGGNCDKVRAAILIEGPQSVFAMIQPKLEKGPYATAYVTGADGTLSQGLVHPGSRRRIGDQRNLPQSIATAYGSVRSATALTANSSGQVTVNAHTVRYGGTNVTYNAVTNAVTGLTVGVTYVIYCIDEAFDGGTRTWLAGTNPDAVMQLGDGVVVAGQITIPSSGSGSGGGGGIGSGDDWCVDADMLLPDGATAGSVQAGDLIPCWNDDPINPAIEMLEVQENALRPGTPTVSITTENGATVAASTCTPMTLRDSRTVRIGEMLGEDALVRDADGNLSWDRVVAVSDTMLRTVARIKVHQRCYFAGSTASATIATHNPILKP